MNEDFPTIQIGRPSSAKGDWVMTLASGFVMLVTSFYLLWPDSWEEGMLLPPIFLIVSLVLLNNFLRYTYGEVGPAGLLYRRPWGWRTAPWSEIACVALDQEIPEALLIKLRTGNRWTKRLRFQRPSDLEDAAWKRLIEHCRSHCGAPHSLHG